MEGFDAFTGAALGGGLAWGLLIVRARARGLGTEQSSSAAAAAFPQHRGHAALKLRSMGFCGTDDSVDVRLLSAISVRYPWVEWGVLFREDKQGTPRFASFDWLDELRRENMGRGGRRRHMRLAGHLCSSYVQQVLQGDASFVRWLHDHIGFQRVQVNATAANGVDTSALGGDGALRGLLASMAAAPEVEFILQRNEETRPLWEALEQLPPDRAPKNLSYLHDESKGLGTLAAAWPIASGLAPVGYAGGLGPSNLMQQLQQMVVPARGKPIWIDMESSLRTLTRGPNESPDAPMVDVFDVNKAMVCVRAALRLGIKMDD